MKDVINTFWLCSKYSKTVEMENAVVEELTDTKTNKKTVTVTLRELPKFSMSTFFIFSFRVLMVIAWILISLKYTTNALVPIYYSCEIFYTGALINLLFLTLYFREKGSKKRNRMSAYKKALNYIDHNNFTLTKDFASESKRRPTSYDYFLGNIVIRTILFFVLFSLFDLNCKGLIIFCLSDVFSKIFAEYIANVFQIFHQGNPGKEEYEEAYDIVSITLEIQNLYVEKNGNKLAVEEIISKDSFWREYANKYGISDIKTNEGKLLTFFFVEDYEKLP